MKDRTAGILRLKAPGSFSNRELFAMFFPILLEQLLINLLAMVDTLLASQLSDAATAGVSHVISIDAMMKTFLSGLATGGSVLTAQWIGQGDLKKASDAARASILSTGILAMLVTAVLSVSPEWFICTLLGRPDEVTLGYAITYFTVSVLSYPFLAIIYCCNATYRAQGNTRLPMFASVSLLVIAMGLKVLLTSVLSLGVLGCGLSNLIAAVVTSAWIFLCMVSAKTKVSFRRSGERLSLAQMLRSFRIGLPVALENALFQLGLVVVQRFVIGYGVIDSAAHGIAKQLQPLSYLPGQGWGMVLLVVVGRCIGKADKEQARRYTLYISGLCFASMLFVNIFCVAFINQIVSLFGGAEETLKLVKWLFLLYCFSAVPLYTPAYALPYALRGAGDARFPMIVSTVTMFALRIGVAYVLGTTLQMGAKGLWIAMVLDWAARTVIFSIRFFGGKWLNKRVI